MGKINTYFWDSLKKEYWEEKCDTIVLGGSGRHAEMRCREQDISAFVAKLMVALKNCIVTGRRDEDTRAEVHCPSNVHFSDKSKDGLFCFWGDGDCENLRDAQETHLYSMRFNAKDYDIGFSVTDLVEISGNCASIVDFCGQLMKFANSYDREIVIASSDGQSSFTVIKEGPLMHKDIPEVVDGKKIYCKEFGSRGGFRFLRDTICIDFIEENKPWDEYLTAITAYINEEKITKLFIFSHSRREIDISFLNNIVVHVDTLSITANCQSLEPVYALQPSSLSVTNQDYFIDFDRLKNCLTRIGVFAMGYKERITCVNESILSCTKLERIAIGSFGQNELNLVAQMPHLKELSLSQYAERKVSVPDFVSKNSICKLELWKVPIAFFDKIGEFPNLTSLTCTQIGCKSLDVLEMLPKLEKININYCTKLTDVSAVAKCPILQEARFQVCKQVTNFDTLSQSQTIRALDMFKCGSVPSIHFIDGMSNLKAIDIVETNVLDGDLTPCLRLEAVTTLDKKHYNLKAEQLPRRIRR